MGLTKKQKEYLKRLQERNKTIPYPGTPNIKADDPHYNEKLAAYTAQIEDRRRLVSQGMQKPMLAGERMTRRRIIRKAFNMAGELALIYSGGVLPTREMRKDTQSSATAAGLVDNVETAIVLQEIFEEQRR